MPFRIDWYFNRRDGWHFHVEPRDFRWHSYFGVWWTRGCDAGINVGRRAWVVSLARRH